MNNESEINLKHRELARFLIAQAFEESRYHRRFHHTLFTVILTLYTALLGFQLAYPNKVSDITTLPLVIMAVALIGVIPAYATWVIFSYHQTIARLNAIIAILSTKLVSDIEGTNLDNEDSTFLGVQNSLMTRFLFFKYKRAVLGGKRLLRVGRGHWFFFLTFFILVVFNGILLAWNQLNQ